MRLTVQDNNNYVWGSQCTLTLIIPGLRYRRFLSADYSLVKSTVNCLRALYPEHSVLFRVEWCRYINYPLYQLSNRGIAFTNDTDYKYFTDRYVCASYELVAFGATVEDAIEDHNKGYVEVCGGGADETFEGDELLCMPIVTVSEIDELDFIMTSDQEQIRSETLRGRTLTEISSEIELPDGIVKMLMIICPGAGYNPASSEIDMLKDRIARHLYRPVDMIVKLCLDTTTREVTYVHLIYRLR